MQGDSQSGPIRVLSSKSYSDLVEHARLVIESTIKGSVSDGNPARNASISVHDSATVVDRIFGIVRGFVVLLHHHGAPNEVLKDFVEGAACYLNVSSEKRFVARCKYMSTAPMAEFLGNLRPTTKEPIWRPKGNFRRWYRARIAKFSRTNVHLWFSWVQAKRSALPLSDDMVLLSYMDHRDAMGNPDPMAPALINELMELLAPVLDVARKRVVSELLDKQLAKASRVGADEIGIPRPLANASRSAAYEASRARGGQMGHMARTLGIDREIERSSRRVVVEAAVENGDYELVAVNGIAEMRPMVQRVEIEVSKAETINELDTMKMYAMRETGLSVREGAEHWGVTMIKVDPVAYERWTSSGIHIDSAAMAAAELGLKAEPVIMKKIIELALEECERDKLHCTIQAVIEPLKVRIISKGPAFSYYVSGGYQKALHGALREIKCFRLIGRPVSPTDLMDCVYESDEPLYWISGDYKASTDNLSAGLSQSINRLLTAGLPFNLIYRACLEPHVCHYPKVRVDESLCDEFKMWCSSRGLAADEYITHKDGEIWVQVPDITQVNAQLMGSRVSFPILCLANLALYLKVKSVSTGILNPSRTQIIQWMNRVLINGDDILFCGPRREFDLLEKFGAMVGLSLSVGKAYVHHAYANVNSTSFVMNLREPGAIPREVQYLNTGLYFGQHKVLGNTGEGEDGEDRTHYVDVIDRVMDGCLPGRQKEILISYLTQHREGILRECGGRNLFIHRSLGGMGVRCPVGWRYDVTKAQMVEMTRRMSSKRANVVENIQPYQFRTLPVFEADKLISPWRAMEAPHDDLRPLPKSYRERRKTARWLLDGDDDLDTGLLELGICEVVNNRTIVERNMIQEVDMWEMSGDFDTHTLKREYELNALDTRMRRWIEEGEILSLLSTNDGL